ncbi:hypothetical protein [Sphingopyxis sp.]|uniref:hypothetical protein n=1 Tax=Sphingopyxis sp. TaxID=1908224 RepID=UPI0025E0E663|nr:hypothetical protein [Sphingopyxis sp.]
MAITPADAHRLWWPKPVLPDQRSFRAAALHRRSNFGAPPSHPRSSLSGDKDGRRPFRLDRFAHERQGGSHGMIKHDAASDIAKMTFLWSCCHAPF